jgi:undecaprenyl phosphate N,N'-diacetylbacillosamine 1-phosphate transferase
MANTFYCSFLKRLLDVIISTTLLILLLPLLAVVIILQAFTYRGKVFFVQKRPGRNERIFRVIKFKTMTDRMDQAGKLLPDAKRLTSFGKLIRKTSIDELPQLLNVLAGDMSLIGPRPLLIEYLSLYNPTQKKRHQVRPGISGWAQVNGRNAITWSKKFELDVWYVENLNLWLDAKILVLTLVKIFKSEHINQDGQATVENFNGIN